MWSTVHRPFGLVATAFLFLAPPVGADCTESVSGGSVQGSLIATSTVNRNGHFWVPTPGAGSVPVPYYYEMELEVGTYQLSDGSQVQIACSSTLTTVRPGW